MLFNLWAASGLAIVIVVVDAITAIGPGDVLLVVLLIILLLVDSSNNDKRRARKEMRKARARAIRDAQKLIHRTGGM